jgi:murein DD-endopeptidase MepM/ murein hydrolase activator NlpD
LVFGVYWKAFVVAVAILIVGPTLMIGITFIAAVHSFGVALPAVNGHAVPPLMGPAGCPVPGAVETQPFGPSSYPFEPPGFGYPHFHTGVDLAAAMGTPVYAVASGLVEAAGAQVDALGIPVGYGYYIKVGAGGGREDLYGHLSAIGVHLNQVVTAGQLIGALGSTGNSTGPHVHFEVRIHGVPVDPASVLRC